MVDASVIDSNCSTGDDGDMTRCRRSRTSAPRKADGVRRPERDARERRLARRAHRGTGQAIAPTDTRGP
jgi:hypothetical protein